MRRETKRVDKRGKPGEGSAKRKGPVGLIGLESDGPEGKGTQVGHESEKKKKRQGPNGSIKTG